MKLLETHKSTENFNYTALKLDIDFWERAASTNQSLKL